MPGRLIPRPGRRGRAALAVAVLSAPLLVILSAPAPVAAQGALAQFRASASADGVRQTVTRPEAPLSNQIADVSVPSAQALVNSLGDSEAYGSYLYPGATVLVLPGLLSGPTGQSLPNYPVLAFSNSPSRPEDDASAGPVTITAKSTPTTSTGTSSSTTPGAGIGRLLATAEATGDATGTLAATARSESTAIEVEGVLRVASVRGTATAERKDGAITSSSTLDVGETTVAGVRVVVTEKGLTLPGQTVPLPDSSPIRKPLADAGITIDLVGTEKIAGGVRSGALRIVVKQATPDGSSATTTYLLGQALASIAAVEADPEISVAGPAAAPAAPPAEGFAVAPDTGTDAGSSAGLAAPADLATGDSPLAAEQAPAAAGGPAPAPQAAGAAPQVVPTALGTIPFAKSSALTFYLVLVLASGVAMASQLALRRFGVRQTWTP